MATMTLPRPTNKLLLAGYRRKVGCTALAHMEPQEPAMVMMAGCHVPRGGGEDWYSLLDHTQHLFWALSIPFGLAHLLHHLLAVYLVPAPSKTFLVKVLVAGQK